MKYSRFLIYTIASCVIVYSLYSLFKIITTTAPDFSVYYQSAQNLISGRNMYTDQTLYTSFAYPPVTAFLYIPLTIFPYSVAQGIFSCVSYGLLYGVVFVCFKLFHTKVSTLVYTVAMTLSLLSFPVKFTFGMGQINIIALFFLLCGIYIFLRKRQGVGSLLVAMSMLLKPQLVVILLVILLCKKINFFTRVSLWILGISIVETLCFGIAPWMHYLSYKIPETMRFTSDIAIYYNQGFLAFAGRIMQGNGVLLYIALSVIAVLLYGISMKHIMLADDRDNKFIQCIVLALPLMLLIEPLSWQHHYVFLIPSLFWVCTQTKKNVVHTVVVALIYIGVSINLQPFIRTYTNIFLLSHVGLATCILYGTLIGILWKKHYDV